MVELPKGTAPPVKLNNDKGVLIDCAEEFSVLSELTEELTDEKKLLEQINKRIKLPLRKMSRLFMNNT